MKKSRNTIIGNKIKPRIVVKPQDYKVIFLGDLVLFNGEVVTYDPPN